jgi:hypothetical protein
MPHSTFRGPGAQSGLITCAGSRTSKANTTATLSERGEDASYEHDCSQISNRCLQAVMLPYLGESNVLYPHAPSVSDAFVQVSNVTFLTKLQVKRVHIIRPWFVFKFTRKMSDTFQVTPWPLEAIPDVIQQLNATFKSGKTLSIEWRKQQLRNVWKMLDVIHRV